MARFSVIIPAYNRETLLIKTIKSVLAQTFTDYDLLIIDDGSTSDIKKAVEGFQDPRIKYFRISHSGGPAVPRNIGIDKVTTEWVCFLDSDDIWYPSKLEIVNRVISKNQKIDAICHDLFVHNSLTGVKKRIKCGPTTKDFYHSLLGWNRCSNSAMTVRKAFLDKNNLRFNSSPNYVSVEDYDLWLNMARCNAIYEFINIPIGEYITETGNISNTEMHKKNLECLLRDHVFKIQEFEPNKKKLWRAVLAKQYIADATACFRNRRLLYFVNNFTKAIFLSPTSVGTYFVLKLSLALKGDFRTNDRLK